MSFKAEKTFNGYKTIKPESENMTENPIDCLVEEFKHAEDLRKAKEYADGYRNGFEDGFHEAMSLCRELYNPTKNKDIEEFYR